MGSNDSVATSGLLTKLTRLEDQVSTLSMELASSKEAISLLTQSLTERDSQIYELESKLAAAQNAQLKTTVSWIDRCKGQIKNGVDEKIINPALAKIRRRIEAMQQLVYEARDVINKKIAVIHENIQTHSALVKQWPEQARLYFEQAVVEPINLLMHETLGSAYSYLKAVRDLVEQKILYPCKVIYEETVVAVLALPAQSRIILRIWLVDPALQKVDMLPDLGRKFYCYALAWLKKSIDQLKALINQGVEYLAEAVKSSSFWNGNNKIEVTY